LADIWQDAGFGLYLHWPFCQAKCPYCDFNSHVVAEIDQGRWEKAYLAEIARLREETGPRTLKTVFFGGGTPSLMAPELVGSVLETVRKAWPTANDLEVTLEANPTSVEAGRVRGYHDAGVNRISMGIQALNDADLRALGRLHSVAEARAAFEIARGTFSRVSFDLIYARQHQTLEAWRAELAEALQLSLDHLSLYQLTIEDGTAFGDRFRRGRLPGLPEDDVAADFYDLTQMLCTDAGLAGYEISNHAAPGAESRHNLVYWRSGDYAGIGPGAHGRLTLDGVRFATETPLSPAGWLVQVEKTGSGELARTALGDHDRFAEHLLMGLRISEGIDLGRIHRDTGLRPRVDRVEQLVEQGLLCADDQRMSVTPGGRPLLNAILRKLLA
jgi:putative oxygen-independent coproporphyrinogen III oxidase